MAQFQRHFVQDLTKPLIVRQCGDLGFSGDNLSDVISVDLYTDGVAYSGGGDCAGACICPDGSTVALTGSVSGKTASVTLTEDCFAIPGQIGIAIRVTSGTTKTTVLKAIYNVEQFATNNPVDPGSRISLDVGDLIDRIDTAVESIPASADQLKAAMAPNFSSTVAYPAWSYVWYNGNLYRFTTYHDKGSWIGTDAVYVALGNDVAEAKSAVEDMGTVSVDGIPLTVGHMLDSGKWGQLSGGSYQHFVFPVSSGDVVNFKCTVRGTVVAFVTNYSFPLTSSTNISYSAATGFTTKITITANTLYEWTAPSDAKYLIVEKVYSSSDVGISVFSVNGYDNTKKLNAQIVDIQNELTDVSNTFETKDELIQSTKDALRYMHGASGITWENGTLDKDTGVFGPSNTSIVSSFIDLHNRNLYICLPEDGSITVKLYYYSTDSESGFGTSGTKKTASYVTTNGTYRYCRVLMYYTSIEKARDDDLRQKAFFLFGYADNYRGKIGQLGVTAFSQCTDEGYYSFIASDLSNLSDAPIDLASGGILFTYTHFGSFTLYQAIYDTSGNKYVRYGTGRFTKTGKSQEDLTITPTFEIGAIVSSNGLNADPPGTKRVRMVDTIEINGGFSLEIPSGMKAEIITYTSQTPIGTDNRGETSFGFLTEGTYLFYPRYAETYFRIYGGYTDDRTITDANVGSQFKMTYFDNADSPKWLALGDSITQGFYSYNNGSSDTFARTLNCWAGIAANKANLRLVNYGVGGSGYVENGTVLDMKNAKDHVTGVDFSGFDCVTLAWGVNDWKGDQNVGSVDSVSGDGTICGNMKYVIETILADNPLIKIFVVTPLNCAGYSKNYGTKATNWGLGYSFANSGTLENVFQAEKAIAEYYGVQLIDQTHQSAVNRENLLTVLFDGVHPSMSCHAVLGAEMAGKITFK